MELFGRSAAENNAGKKHAAEWRDCDDDQKSIKVKAEGEVGRLHARSAP